MLSVKNLRAFLDAYQLDFAADPARRDTLLLSLERSYTPVAMSHLRQRLNGPLVPEKERVLRTLFRSPRPELLEDIIREARDPANYTRRDAVFCLGAYDEPVAEEVLREIAGLPSGVSVGSSVPEQRERDPDIEVVAIALKSLARHGVSDILPTIRELLNNRLPTRATLDLSVAEAILDPEGEQLAELFQRAFRHGSERFATTKLMIAFDRLEFNPSIEFYLRSEVRSPGRGFDDLIEDASEFTVVYAQRAQLARWVSIEEFQSVWHWVKEQLPGSLAHRWAQNLSASLKTTEPPAALSRLAALSALYTLHRCLESNEVAREEARSV